ncbi:MAG: hypothetical protein LBR15_01155 [Methanobrevibacter sp.]|jgi:hypothetical protein|nr:hypothetical protein [Candidatus Methanovirga australis]
MNMKNIIYKQLINFFKDVFTTCECVSHENHRVLERTVIPEEFPNLESVNRYEESVVLEDLDFLNGEEKND